MKCLFLSYAISMLFVAGAAYASPSDLSIIAPPDKTFVNGRSISVVVRINENSPDELQLTSNEKKQQLPLKTDRSLVCYTDITLATGRNRITVAALKKGKVIGQKEITVFCNPEPVSGFGAEPPGFTRYVFHTPDNEKRCSPCHRMDFSEAKRSHQDSGDSPCFTCHKKMLSGYRFVHGPAAVWSCLVCHRPKTAGQVNSALQGDDKSCPECHAETLDDWKTKKYQHGPTEAGLCVICHNPHASDLPFFLRMNPGHLCNSCHEKKILQPHVISGFTRNGHPLNVNAKASRLGMSITCVSCHNPHAGDNPRFLKGYKGSLTGFCMNCHKF